MISTKKRYITTPQTIKNHFAMKRFEKTIPFYTRKDVPFILFIVFFSLAVILSICISVYK
jgi:hypothetical protein